VSRYSLNLPPELKKEAEQWADRQGISLSQFILWSVAEKVGELRQSLDDPAFPRITYRRSASGQPTPVLRGTGIRVQTIVNAARHWEMTAAQVAREYDLLEAQVKECLAFYEAHRAELDGAAMAEENLIARVPTQWVDG
jgi:uncharacterized protein (DUF433 family)